MKVAVTGAAGFLGTHLVLHLAQQGHLIRGLRRSESAIPALIEPLVEWHVADLSRGPLPQGFPGDADLCIHLAALYAEGEAAWPALEATNIVGTQRVLDACKRDGVRRFVQVSTMGTRAPCRRGGRASEADEVNRDQISAYAKSKLLGEECALSWDGGEVVLVLPSAPIGAFDWKPSVTGQRILDILNGHFPRLLQGPVNYVPAQSCVSGIVLAGMRGEAGKAYLLGGEEYAPEAFLKLVAEAAKVKAPHRSVSELLLSRRKLTPGALQIDDSFARQSLTYMPTPLALAIAEAAADFRARGLAP
jgi:dihydroflavonol-4-reductase